MPAWSVVFVILVKKMKSKVFESCGHLPCAVVHPRRLDSAFKQAAVLHITSYRIL